ncbi:ABC transporter permease [Patescibacteria group bacterium]
MKRPIFLGVNAEPNRFMVIILFMIPFLLSVGVYHIWSSNELKKNPSNKLSPSISKIVKTTKGLFSEKDEIRDEYQLLEDTVASLKRIGGGLGLAMLGGLTIGIIMGVFPGMNALLFPFVTFCSIVPPLAILPILLIMFGADEMGKIVLIFIGTFFVITLSIRTAVRDIPRQQLVKAFTLGASTYQWIFRIVLPQVIPRLIEATIISLGPAWIFLISSEIILSSHGLGYRIFLMRRGRAMDVIIPYVLWMTILGFLMFWILKKIMQWKYSWYLESK